MKQTKTTFSLSLADVAEILYRQRGVDEPVAFADLPRVRRALYLTEAEMYLRAMGKTEKTDRDKTERVLRTLGSIASLEYLRNQARAGVLVTKDGDIEDVDANFAAVKNGLFTIEEVASLIYQAFADLPPEQRGLYIEQAAMRLRSIGKLP